MSFSAHPELILPPAQIDCKWWKQGYCARGKTCYFRHDEALAGVDNKKPDDAAARERANDKSTAKVASSPADGDWPSSSEAQICTICLETPDTYGLLLNCDHVFCLGCIRDWRSSTSAPLPSNEELKDTTKTCPLCRAHSDFIIPSSQFPIISSTESTPPQVGENTAKKEIVDRYLGRLKNIQCRYFSQSIKDSTVPFRPKCKFGNSCHYAHTHPITKEPYIFSEEEMNRGRRRARPRRPRVSDRDEIAMMEVIFNAVGGGYDSDDEWGCEDEDLAFFESGSVGLGFGLDLDFDEFDHNYGWD